ncbi:hypothetical protein ATE92_2174 [Ulvibacter sp. MAR_2010_11]|uniref:hypothetical protein n=1 Tax=Ulvibacter sp. MAR_2010_11 TaxID=1250229 RepID=UPI000C2BBCF2|nr:hypothetical protein [Ulvibacter sp. MAR_2010_11]PKA84004.1 hypothetical protein ATE92_2174 [Ulvibacter sp. MAR_2010_11]
MKVATLDHLLADFKEDYYMYIPLTIILQSCVGSIAAMLILSNGFSAVTFIELTLCVSLSMLYNAALLAQLKPKFSFGLLVVSLLLNTLFIIINLI